MPKELNRRLGMANLSVRLWTLKDKDSMFRSKRPDVYIVELSAKSERVNAIIMSKDYSDYASARSHYDNFLRAFGEPIRSRSGRKQSP